MLALHGITAFANLLKSMNKIHPSIGLQAKCLVGVIFGRSMSWDHPRPAPCPFRCQQLTWRLGYLGWEGAEERLKKSPDFAGHFFYFCFNTGKAMSFSMFFPWVGACFPLDSQVLAARASAVQAGWEQLPVLIRPGCFRWSKTGKTPWEKETETRDRAFSADFGLPFRQHRPATSCSPRKVYCHCMPQAPK